MKVLAPLGKIFAVAAGLLMCLITLVTCISILGREVLGQTVPGDFELVGLATGSAIALFMPYCQLERGNIIVDFFTIRLSRRVHAVLDRIGALVLACCFALLAWRTALGGQNSWATHSGSMLLGFPEYLIYLSMVPPFVLTAAIAIHQALYGFAAPGKH